VASKDRSERQTIARVAAHSRWAGTKNRAQGTAAARQAAWDRFDRLVDPNGELDPSTRSRMAASARRAHFSRMALRSAQVRRARKGGGAR
jgi:hypothetical protein